MNYWGDQSIDDRINAKRQIKLNSVMIRFKSGLLWAP